MSELRYSPEALDDVEAARDKYEGQRPGLGEVFLNEVDAIIERINDHSAAYPMVDHSIRRALLRRFPYAVFYDPTLNVILAVQHVRRHPHAWRDR